MSIVYMNVSNRKALPKLWLCMPNKKVVSPLLDIYNLKMTIRLGAISEMSFTVPAKVEKNHKYVSNPLIKKIKDRYFLKMVFENQTEYFVFLNQNKELSSDGKSIVYKLYSIGILLNDKQIRSYNEESLSLSQFATAFLKESGWKLGSVDADFDVNINTKNRRSMEISSATVLEALFQLAEKFNAVILFNTVQETVSFYKPVNLGLNKGVKLKEGRLLSSYNVELNAEEMVTRLHVYGKDGLEFRNLTPTGSNYLEDFSYFTHGFECDDNYVVTGHSDYMSDDLCIALLKYKQKISSNEGLFKTLSTALTNSSAIIQQHEQLLSDLNTQMSILLNERDVINSTYGDSAVGRPDHTNIINAIASKQAEIDAKKQYISSLKTQSNSTLEQIKSLQGQLKVENNFTAAQINELDKFIIVKDYTNDSITDEEVLLKEGIEIFETLNEPPINVSMDIEGYLESIETNQIMQKISLGDTVRLYDLELNVNLRLRILEISFDFETLSVNLTIANGKDVIDDAGKLMDMVYTSSSTSTTVNMDKFKWNLAVTANDNVTRLINSEWDSVKNSILGGYNQTIVISERGLVAKDHTDPMNWLVLQNGQLAITNDNGNSWKSAITKNGIFAERLVGKILIGNKLHIEDEEGIITITGGNQTVFDKNGYKRVELGKYTGASGQIKYGLKIYSGAIEIVDGLSKDQIDSDVVTQWDSSEENAKAYADSLKITINKEMDDVSGRIDDLKFYVDGAFEDGVISQAEAIAIEKYINNINAEKADIDAKYTYIYGINVLPTVNKTALYNAKTAYNTAHTNLINSINKAIADGVTTVTEKNDVDAKFATYRTATATLRTAFETSIDILTTTKVTNADANLRGELRLTSPLPTSLTLDTTGITAYTSNTSNFARLDYRGLYVQGGAVDIRTTAYSNVGVILNGSGLRGYNSSGALTFDISSANGRVTVQGSFVVQTSGSSNAGVKMDESGIRAYDSFGSQTFYLNASNGSAYFSGSISGSSISSGSISGTSITGGTINGGSITGGSINGTTITGTTINGNTISGGNISGTTISGGNISGTSISGTTISGGSLTGTTITGGSVTTTTDLTIGNNIYLGNGSSAGTRRSINFNYQSGGAASISFSNDVIQLSSINGTDISGGLSFSSGGTLDLSRLSDVNWGRFKPQAVFG